ncbi:hypothetical protein BKI52_31170 [marine bacterium AO1-C]|nr:hypothetical protein BKI52_31170 [marine bacterium AO1-C]
MRHQKQKNIKTFNQMRKLLYSALFLTTLAVVFSSCSTDETTTTSATATTITDGTDALLSKPSKTYVDKGEGTGTVTWTSGNVYVLDGLVFVNDGQTLTIEAGTVIKGKKTPSTGATASALVVARGGKIIAEGNASAPIIFTGENDDLNGALGTTQGEWGGLIVLGKAGLNSTPGQTAIEGIPTTEPRGIYGGTDDADNSGTLKYISIRHGGAVIGADNEINGLTLGGVGTGTVIDYVEVFANKDDGIEWFGGTVGVNHAVVGFCGDDSFDYDEGYRGTNQFALIYQDPTGGDRGGEHDGGTSPETGTPFATPVFWNVTSVGNGTNRAMTLRDNAGGKYYNSIFYNWSKGVDIEYLNSTSSKDRYDAGDIAFANNTFGMIGGATTTANDLFKVGVITDKEPTTAEQTAFQTKLQTELSNANGNTVNDAVISRANVIPAAVNATITTGAPTAAAYRGAFSGSTDAWYTGWTATAAQIK